MISLNKHSKGSMTAKYKHKCFLFKQSAGNMKFSLLNMSTELKFHFRSLLECQIISNKFILKTNNETYLWLIEIDHDLLFNNLMYFRSIFYRF